MADNTTKWILGFLALVLGGAGVSALLNKTSKPASSSFTYTGNTLPSPTSSSSSGSSAPSVPTLKKPGCGCSK